MPLEVTLNNNAKYFNLGDWISYYSYAEFDGNSVELKYFKNNFNK
jgi:UDP-2,3-diacylglucosamine hydrolase